MAAIANRASVLLYAGRCREAIAEFEDVLRRVPSHELALEGLQNARQMLAQDRNPDADKPIIDLPLGAPGPTLLSMAADGRAGAYTTQVLGRLRTDGPIARAEDILCVNWRLDVPPVDDLPANVAPWQNQGVLANALTHDRRAYVARWVDGASSAGERDLSTPEMHQWLRLLVAGVLSEVTFIASETWSADSERSIAPARAVLRQEGLDAGAMQLRQMRP